MDKERKPDFTPGLPVAGKVPRSMREKMDLQASHQRGREGAARKRILMKGLIFDSTRMSPEPRNACEEAVNFELSATGHILEGCKLKEQAIDPSDPLVSRLAKEPSVLTDPDYDPSRFDPCRMYRSILEDITDTAGVDPEVIDIFISEQEGQRQVIPPEISPRGLRFREDFS